MGSNSLAKRNIKRKLKILLCFNSPYYFLLGLLFLLVKLCCLQKLLNGVTLYVFHVVNTDEALDSTCNPLRIIGMILRFYIFRYVAKFCLK